MQTFLAFTSFKDHSMRHAERNTMVWYTIIPSPENHEHISSCKQSSNLIYKHNFQTQNSRQYSSYNLSYSQHKAFTVQALRFDIRQPSETFFEVNKTIFPGNGGNSKSCIEVYCLLYITSRSISVSTSHFLITVIYKHNYKWIYCV